MIKAVLFDLDDTLILSNPEDHFPVYLRALSEYGSDGKSPDQFCQWVMESYGVAVASNDATQTLAEKFMANMSVKSGIDARRLQEILVSFYRDCYEVVRPFVKPQPGAAELFDFIVSNGIRIVVATNPGLPRQAIEKRLEWGGLSADDPRIELITSLENMHFGKPRAEYYEEIMLHLSLSPGEAVMIGDDVQNDIVGAQVAGLPTYNVRPDGTSTRENSITASAGGSFKEFSEIVVSGGLEKLLVPASSQHTYVRRLAAFPSGISQLVRTHGSDVLECAPADHEWSAQDIICHLRDHEGAEDRDRLEQIVRGTNPFLSANYDPWSHAHEYADVSAQKAFLDFAAERLKTVKWLTSLSPQDWAKPARHAIFGPTNFLEMVRFTTEHDLTHLKQMRAAIEQAVTVCA